MLEAHCLAALSNWSLFLLPLRDPRSIWGIVHTLKKQPSWAGIAEIPLKSMVHVFQVSGRENLHTFASHEANCVSRPFRIITVGATVRSGQFPPPIDLIGGTTLRERMLTLVGFESISKLRYFVVMARESLAIRTVSVHRIMRMTASTSVAAKHYLKCVHEAMTGPLQSQVKSCCSRER